MKTIIPIFFKKECEKNFLWDNYKNSPYIDHVIHQTKLVTNSIPTILTDQDDLAVYLLDKAIDVYSVDKNSRGKKFDRPYPWNFKLIQEMITCKGLDISDDFLLLNLRTPGLSRHIIKEAVDQYHRSGGKCLISMTEMIDNPVQLDAYFRIVDCDLLCCLERKQQSRMILEDIYKENKLFNGAIKFEDYVLSKPCFFDWSQFFVFDDFTSRRLYKIFLNQFYSGARPVCIEQWENDTPPFSKTLYYIAEAALAARRLFTLKGLHPKNGICIKALSFTKDLHYSPCLIVESMYDDRLLIYIEKDLLQINPTLILMPFNEQTTGSTIIIEYNNDFSDDYQTFDFLGHCFLPFGYLPQNLAQCGFFVSLLKDVKQGTADISLPLEFENASWSVDPVTMNRKNLLNGQEITGRQHFPEVYVEDGSFMIISGNKLGTIDKIITEGLAEKYILDYRHSALSSSF